MLLRDYEVLPGPRSLESRRRQSADGLALPEKEEAEGREEIQAKKIIKQVGMTKVNCPSVFQCGAATHGGIKVTTRKKTTLSIEVRDGCQW